MAFKAYDDDKAATAWDELTAQLEVPNNEPVIPCNTVKLPLTVIDPVTTEMDEVIVWTIIVWAVNVPLTVKLSADDAVAAWDALTAFKT